MIPNFLINNAFENLLKLSFKLISISIHSKFHLKNLNDTTFPFQILKFYETYTHIWFRISLNFFDRKQKNIPGNKKAIFEFSNLAGNLIKFRYKYDIY